MIGNNLLLGSGDEGYNLTRSLRFRSSASAYLNRTPASAGNQKTWTYSDWIKRGALGTDQVILSAGQGAGTLYFYLRFLASDALDIFTYDSNTATFIWRLTTTQVFRDPSAWYHLVISTDTTQATAANRVKIYVNGTQVTAFTTASYPSLNYDTRFNANIAHYISSYIGSANFADCYQTEVNSIDGQALAPSSFGSTNALTGVWQPARYVGTYGTNGFYLPFTDNSGATATTIGKDFSGNSNNWTPNNISVTAGVTYDSMTDVPTLTSATAANYCVGNPLSIGPNASLSDGNLTGTLTGSGGWAGSICGLTSGKWYYEATNTASAGNSRWVGFLSDVYTKNDNAWSFSTQTALYANDARNGNNASYGATWTTNDVIGVALDLSTSSGSVTFYKNGVSQGVMFSSLTSSAVWRPLISGGGTGTTMAMNFGQRPFAYTPPSGFVALNTFNLPTSTIVKGNTVMDATLYTGNGSTQTVTNAAGFKPDLVWDKRRDAAGNHGLFDSVRGGGNWISSNATNAETAGVNGVTAFNSNGFSVGSHPDYNTNAATQVAWQWQAGQGSTSSNTSGTITSTVSVNASAGFSICTLTTPASGICTFGHGLGVAPSLVLTKYRSSTSDWLSYHSSVGNTAYLLLNGTNAATTNANTWNNTSPTSSVVTLGSDFSGTRSIVAYCWTPIAGYSAFGGYTGNGSTNGAFIYTGFRPRFVLVKQTDAAGNWLIWDTARSTYNQMQDYLIPNSSSQELNNVLVSIDVLSNGFKCRTADDDINGNGNSYIYMAFAENPTKFALAR
jgi:hypothetical protein